MGDFFNSIKSIRKKSGVKESCPEYEEAIYSARENVKDKSGLSLKRSVTVCGIEIKKMPFGAYLEAMEILTEAPFGLLQAAFGDMPIEAVLQGIADFDKGCLEAAIRALFKVAPEYMLKILSKLTGIDEARLKNDETIGISGIIEIIEAFVEVNGLGKLFRKAGGWMKKIRVAQKNTGSRS